MAKKRSAFHEFVDEPQCFSDGSYVLCGECYTTKEEAAAEFSRYFGANDGDFDGKVEPEAIQASRVRFQFPSSLYHDSGECDGPSWFLGAQGKGSKPVWVWGRI